MLEKIKKKIESFVNFIKEEKEKNVYKPSYKLVEIKEKNNEFVVVIKLINKNMIFEAKPEEILANDRVVDHFSPRDVRTLTYLGYLGISGPKYQILAKNLYQKDKVVFILSKKGHKEIISKTASEIFAEEEIIGNMKSEDAKTIGYTVASESIFDEKKQKEALSKEETLNKKE